MAQQRTAKTAGRAPDESTAEPPAGGSGTTAAAGKPTPSGTGATRARERGAQAAEPGPRPEREAGAGQPAARKPAATRAPAKRTAATKAPGKKTAAKKTGASKVAAPPKPPTAKATATTPAAPAGTTRSARSGAGLDRGGAAHGHSVVETLLAEHIEQAREESAARLRSRSAPAPEQRTESRSSAPSGPRHARTEAPLPPAEDVLLGAASLVAEHSWRLGTSAVAAVSDAAARFVALLRGVAPAYASAQAEAGLNALAERGRRVRHERTETLGAAMTAAIQSAATSDAVREMTVAAIEEATDDVLAVMLPAVLEAVTEMETQERLDELMAGLLLRQLPSALEKTLPGVMLRTATKPALGLVPLLGGALPGGTR